ncbi:uncharacterized protein N0V89_002604 [Didymosphaeria variabile]|uniref:FAS1 domain-containing protein n=1 Tax=Didymosphaeria variabile TaxID=1932322 RepID=A0A9W9CEJ7_9PLEO|nr:uncharacterized protein N0V89_002604 [Didymosphaeria variabile]KAJ4358025.1 hypothetical protein N0V89_002604 [Didymosphaeria variabile]
MRTSIAFFACVSSVLAQAPSLTDLIASQPDLSTIGAALGSVPDLAETLAGLSNITILAPTNSAFEALLAQEDTPESVAVNSSDMQAIAAILAYHVLNGTYVSSDFSETPAFVSSLFLPSFDGSIRTNVTDGQNVGLLLDGENATILSGELKSANVIEADIQAANSVTVHKIDTVLTVPRNASTTLSKVPDVEVTAALGALTAASLVETIDSVADLTIFVPNNDAFTTAASAFANASIETLTNVLTYHAVTGAVAFSSDITNTTVKTVNGNDLTLSVGVDGTVYVDNAKVVLANIILSNGVAHIIDTVLNPEDEIENPTPAATPTPAFPGATAIGTDVPYTSALGAAPTAGTASSAPAPTPSPSEFPGAAVQVKGALGGAVIGLGLAMML